MKLLAKTMLCAAAFAFVFSSATGAHETLIKVENPNPKKGEQFEAQIMVGHVVIDNSEEVTDPDKADVAIVKGTETYPARVTGDEEAALSRISVEYPVDGTAWLTMHAKPVYMSQTPEGMKEGDKNTIKGTEVLFTDKYEKFFKVLLNADSSDTSYAKPLGQGLEIVPLNNPADLNVGDYLKIQVLQNGKPVFMPVFASYDGFTEEENMYAFYLAPEDPDNIMVKVHQPGLWVILVKSRISGGRGAEIRNHHLTATLEFEVK